MTSLPVFSSLLCKSQYATLLADSCLPSPSIYQRWKPYAVALDCISSAAVLDSAPRHHYFHTDTGGQVMCCRPDASLPQVCYLVQDDDVEVAPRARAAPRRAAVATMKKYIDIDESDSDVISLNSDSEGSEFELSG